MSSKSVLGRPLSAAITMVFVGCAINNVSLELLVKADSSIGNTITCLQFVSISLITFWPRITFALDGVQIEKRRLPIRYYAKTTLAFITVSLINNIVFMFNISLPFHMLFRSCSLVVNMALGLLVFQKVYTRYQVISCLLITAGVIIATFADSVVQIGCCGNDDIRASTNTSRSLESGLFTWFVGVSLLTISLVLSSILGHWQESGYRKYGRYPQENMFYSHVFALPVFLLLAPDIATRLPALISRPSPFFIPVIGTPLSYSAIMVINLLSQYVCVRGVYDITCLSTTLTCTFTITIRKFLSLLISGIFMGNNLTLLHWAGAGLVFIGTVLYSTPRGVQNAIPHRKIQ